jgi:cell division protein FtsB
MLKTLIVLLSLLLINLQYQLWFGKSSYGQLRVLQQQIAQQRQENAVLETRNAALEKEVIGLKNDLEIIEEYARLELGMIKKGEVYYQIVK